MIWNKVIYTDRLALQPFDEQHAEFIQELVNTPDWIKFIGDRNIQSTADAVAFIRNGPMALWQRKGYGPYTAVHKASCEPICYVGWVKRDFLDAPDLGYACLPRFYRQGFVFEAAFHLLQVAREARLWPHVYAIALPNNTASIGVLNKLGFTKHDTMLEQPENIWVDIYKREL
jgi:RimJ/RimL family protein N-acetyltransferase